MSTIATSIRAARHLTMLDQVKPWASCTPRARYFDRIDDMIVPGEKAGLVSKPKGRHRVQSSIRKARSRAASSTTRSSKSGQVTNVFPKNVQDHGRDDRTGRYINPIYIMADSAPRFEATDPPASGMRADGSSVG